MREITGGKIHNNNNPNFLTKSVRKSSTTSTIIPNLRKRMSSNNSNNNTKKTNAIIWCEPVAIHAGWMHNISAANISSWHNPIDCERVAATAMGVPLLLPSQAALDEEEESLNKMMSNNENTTTTNNNNSPLATPKRTDGNNNVTTSGGKQQPEDSSNNHNHNNNNSPHSSLVNPFDPTSAINHPKSNNKNNNNTSSSTKEEAEQTRLIEYATAHFESLLKDGDLADDRHLRRMMEMLVCPGIFSYDHDVPRYSSSSSGKTSGGGESSNYSSRQTTIESNQFVAGGGPSSNNGMPPLKTPLKWNWSVLKLSQTHFLASFISLSSYDEYSSLGFCIHLDCDSYETALRQARWMLACGAVRLLVAAPERENPSPVLHQDFAEEVSKETWKTMEKQRWQHFLSAVARYTLPKKERYRAATERFFKVMTLSKMQLEMQLENVIKKSTNNGNDANSKEVSPATPRNIEFAEADDVNIDGDEKTKKTKKTSSSSSTTTIPRAFKIPKIKPSVFSPELSSSKLNSTIPSLPLPPAKYLINFKQMLSDILIKGYAVQLVTDGLPPIVWRAWRNFFHITLFSLLPNVEQEGPLSVCHATLCEGLVPGLLLTACPKMKSSVSSNNNNTSSSNQQQQQQSGTTPTPTASTSNNNKHHHHHHSHHRQKGMWDNSLRIKRFSQHDRVREDSAFLKPLVMQSRSASGTNDQESDVVNMLIEGLAPFFQEQQLQQQHEAQRHKENVKKMKALQQQQQQQGNMSSKSNNITNNNNQKDSPSPQNSSAPMSSNTLHNTTNDQQVVLDASSFNSCFAYYHQVSVSLLSQINVYTNNNNNTAASSLNATLTSPSKALPTTPINNFDTTTTTPLAGGGGIGSEQQNQQQQYLKLPQLPQQSISLERFLGAVVVNSENHTPSNGNNNNNQETSPNSPSAASTTTTKSIEGGSGASTTMSRSVSHVLNMGNLNNNNNSSPSSTFIMRNYYSSFYETNSSVTNYSNSNNIYNNRDASSSMASPFNNNNNNNNNYMLTSSEDPQEGHFWLEPNEKMNEMISNWRNYVLRQVSDIEFRISRLYFCSSRLLTSLQQSQSQSQPQQSQSSFQNTMFIRCTCDRCLEDAELLSKCDPFVARLLHPTAKQLQRLLKKFILPMLDQGVNIDSNNSNNNNSGGNRGDSSSNNGLVGNSSFSSNATTTGGFTHHQQFGISSHYQHQQQQQHSGRGGSVGIGVGANSSIGTMTSRGAHTLI